MRLASFYLLVVVCMLCVADTCAGQAAVGTYRNIILFSPLKVIDFENPGFEFGYQRNMGERFATEVQATWQNQILWGGKPYPLGYSGARLGIGEKYYLPNSKKLHQRYVELEVVGLDVDYRIHANVSKEDPNYSTRPQYEYPDTFNVHKQTISVNFKTGETVAVSRHIMLDWCIGFGLKFKAITHSGAQYPGYYMTGVRLGSLFGAGSEAGNRTTINVPCTVRMCYVF